jgi:hypothetical protein
MQFYGKLSGKTDKIIPELTSPEREKRGRMEAHGRYRQVDGRRGEILALCGKRKH